MARVHVVIPVYNNWTQCHNLLWDLYRYCVNDIASVVVVNDCSDEEEMVSGGLRWWEKESKLLPLKVYSNEYNQGFLKTANFGMSKVKGEPFDVIMLISTDVSIKAPIMEQALTLCDSEKSLVGGRLLNWDTGWNTFNGTIYPYLEGWLLAASQKSWETLGYFDERYAPCDYEDVDLSTKATHIGFTLEALNHPLVRHLGGQSIGYSPEREAKTKINRIKFMEKWVNK